MYVFNGYTVYIDSILFPAGADTTRMTFQWMLALCVQYPEVQARIHEEIDEVIGESARTMYSLCNLESFSTVK